MYRKCFIDFKYDCHIFFSLFIYLIEDMSDQAINETLLLLTRQYRDIKEELETTKFIFIKEKSQKLNNPLDWNGSRNASLPEFPLLVGLEKLNRQCSLPLLIFVKFKKT